jgi:segregation and condensation protein A
MHAPSDLPDPTPEADATVAPDGVSAAGSALSGLEAPAGAASYRVQLPEFEGPLDLLLHLIQEHELDILDIPIAFITEKYVEYITLMEELNIDLASEYLVMAATLLHIKSKTLLPSVPADQLEDGVTYEEDPRADLVRRLLEYQKYKQAAAHLGDRDVLGRDVFTRGVALPGEEGPAPLAPLSIFKLLEAFQSVVDRAQVRVDHEISLERFSITDRINQLVDVLRSRPRVTFLDLFEGQQTRGDLIVTFLALLEMTRLRMTRLSQEGPLEPIIVELAVRDDDAVATGASPAEAAAPLGTVDFDHTASPEDRSDSEARPDDPEVSSDDGEQED